jgi:aromatic-L-amino-acid decarboxylase
LNGRPLTFFDGFSIMRALETTEEELAKLGERALALALEYWSSVESRPAVPNVSGQTTQDLFSRPWPDEPVGADVLDEFREIAAHARPSGGRFFGYVFGSGEPVGALGEFLSAVLNQNSGAWRSAPSAVTIERTVVRWLADAVGCTGFSGSLCGGGSAGNLIALAMAREAKMPANETGARPCTIYTSDQVHMSVPKAIAILGIGRANLHLIPCDEQFRMRIDALESAISEDRLAGRTPIAIIATAGTVNVGAIDPLTEIAAVAKREQLWMHVDGAYGGLAALAVPEKYQGLELADSLSLDAHKWLYQPVECGCVLYRDRSIARATFSHTGDYVRTFSEDPIEGFAFFDESFELSRRFRALKLWMSLRYHGRRAYQEAMLRDLSHARMLAEEIEANPALELLAPVELSAVCFRHRDRDNAALLRRLLARGHVYLSNATIDGQFALRACFVNHRTRDAAVRSIISEVEAAASDLNQ